METKNGKIDTLLNWEMNLNWWIWNWNVRYTGKYGFKIGWTDQIVNEILTLFILENNWKLVNGWVNDERFGQNQRIWESNFNKLTQIDAAISSKLNRMRKLDQEWPNSNWKPTKFYQILSIGPETINFYLNQIQIQKITWK